MVAMTDYLENQIGDHIFRTASFAKPTALLHRLFTAAPGEAGGGTEVIAGVGYAAVDLPPLDTNYNGTHGTTSGPSSGTSGIIDNAVVIQYGSPTGNWGVVTHHSIDDQSGNMLIYGALTNAKTINNGDPAPSFPAGNLQTIFD